MGRTRLRHDQVRRASRSVDMGDQHYEAASIEGAPEDALRALLNDPEIAKEEALARCRTTHASELEIPGRRDGLVDAARRAGASLDEIHAAFTENPDATTARA